MISISKLYCGRVEPGDILRYEKSGRKLPTKLLHYAREKKPVVVWNCTRRCNLHCRHCYSKSSAECDVSEEMTAEEARAFLEDLADFGVPVLLFSGGEPLLREDLPELAEYAIGLGLRTVISTNGTLITGELAARLKDIGVSYVGVSLDGVGEVHDRFRGQQGAFERALRGMRHCLDHGLKVGVRFTITRENRTQIPRIFDLVQGEGLQRACFYHLVYSGRAEDLQEHDLTHEETRAAVDEIIDRTASLYGNGHSPEVLTVDNHADGPYLYLRMLREGRPEADDVYELLRRNGGSSSGRGIGCVGWSGEVHPNQFWRHVSVGNVRERPFSEIWTDYSNPLMAKLQDRTKHLHGRCRECRFLRVCGGNCRTRAEAVTGDLWAPDPACYLTDREIGVESAVTSSTETGRTHG